MSREPAGEPEAGRSSPAADRPEGSGPLDRSGAPEGPGTAEGAEVEPISLTLVELANEAGVDVSTVRELERFGLVAGRSFGPEVLYDGDSLDAARIAAAFASYGIEPRHLRLYRNAVDRELDLLGQVVAPFLRQRSRDATRAAETMAHLAALGEGLRRALQRRAMREYLGGD